MIAKMGPTVAPWTPKHINKMEIQNRGLFIREATNADLRQVTSLISSVLLEFGLNFEPDGTDADLKDLEKSYFSRGGYFEVVVNSSGTIVGTIGLYIIDEESCELRKMYLVPEVRGLGLGRDLLERTITRARELGYKRMILETQSALKQAIKLYTGFGFKAIEPDHLSPRADRAYALDL